MEFIQVKVLSLNIFSKMTSSINKNILYILQVKKTEKYIFLWFEPKKSKYLRKL